MKPDDILRAVAFEDRFKEELWSAVMRMNWKAIVERYNALLRVEMEKYPDIGPFALEELSQKDKEKVAELIVQFIMDDCNN